MKTLTLTINVTEEEYQAYMNYLQDNAPAPSISFKHVTDLHNKKELIITNNERGKRYKKAVGAVTELFSDKSVSQSDTRRSLETLIGEIQVMIEALGG
jgi:hypothetical protein